MSEVGSEKGPEDNTLEDLQIKMEALEKRFLGTSLQDSQTPFAPRSTLEEKIARITGEKKFGDRAESSDQKVSTKLPSVKLPEFNGQDLEEFLDDFCRWLRMSGLSAENDLVKMDWLLESCVGKTRPIIKKLVQETSSLEVVLQSMAKLFPKLDNDLTIRSKLEKVQPLTHQCEPAQVAQLFLEIEELMGKMSRGAMSDQEKFILLTKKIHPKTYQEMRSDRFFKE